MRTTDLFFISFPASTLYGENKQRKTIILKLHLAHATGRSDLSLKFSILMLPYHLLHPHYFSLFCSSGVWFTVAGKAWEWKCEMVFIHNQEEQRNEYGHSPHCLLFIQSGILDHEIVLSIQDKSSFLSQILLGNN